jgi:hypothetical protein
MTSIDLPIAGRRLEAFRLSPPRQFPAPGRPFSRVAFSAAHVVADPWAAVDPGLGGAIDWDATMAYRRHLWSLGLGVAEAMDTAQRGMGLDWPQSLELIGRSVREAAQHPGALLASGAGTDHLAAGGAYTIDEVIAAYEMQCAAVEGCGGAIILMASRALTAAARGPDDYRLVYGRILSQLRGKAILHWLGEMFDPALQGYWGAADHWAAMDVCLDVIHANADKIDGIKISLLDREKEEALRRRLPPGCRMYTGDDFNYPDLIAGAGGLHSDALLGIFDPIAPAAAAALGRLAEGDEAGFHAILAPTLPLSRHIFAAPTRFYKTGVVFMAYLNGHQDHFAMIGGQQSARSLLHLAEVFRLADGAGLLRDPDLACGRMRAVMATLGVG